MIECVNINPLILQTLKGLFMSEEINWPLGS